MRKQPLSAICTCSLLLTLGTPGGIVMMRTIEFDTRQVTPPNVVVSPDVKTPIFTSYPAPESINSQAQALHYVFDKGCSNVEADRIFVANSPEY